MRVHFDEDTGYTYISFTREDIEEAKRMLRYAIERYGNQGYDTSAAQTVLIQMEETNTTSQ